MRQRTGCFPSVVTGILASMFEPKDLAREKSDAAVDLHGILFAKVRIFSG